MAIVISVGVGFVVGVVLTLLFRVPVENKLKAEKAELEAKIKAKL